MKRALIYILLGIVVTLSVIVGVQRWLKDRPDIRFGKERAAIITQIENLSRLETTSFSIDKIIEASTGYTGLRQFFFGDKLILVAQGKVIAGFDFGKMQPADFSGSGTEIIVNLPQAEIFSVNIDNSKTRVFDRDRGIFTSGEINLEAEARQKAEVEIRKAACEGGILSNATEQGKKQMELLLRAAGFTSVTINAVVPACK